MREENETKSMEKQKNNFSPEIKSGNKESEKPIETKPTGKINTSANSKNLPAREETKKKTQQCCSIF